MNNAFTSGTWIAIGIVSVTSLLAIPTWANDNDQDIPVWEVQYNARTKLYQKGLMRIVGKPTITYSDANYIAESYFHLHVGCGALDGIKDGGSQWEVLGAFGIVGTPIEGFFIELIRKLGELLLLLDQVISTHSNCYASFLKLLLEIINNALIISKRRLG